MTRKHSLWILTFFWLPVAGHAQDKEAVPPVQIRAVLHDPVHPAAELFYTDKKGVVAKLDFRPQDLSRPLFTLPVNGSLVLYDKADIDPKNPEASLAASCKLPPNIKLYSDAAYGTRRRSSIFRLPPKGSVPKSTISCA